MSKYYLTTTLPYVNGDPHIGFALEIVRADALARILRKNGHEVFFNTGTDEHGLKIFQKAKEFGLETKTYVDKQSQAFQDLMKELKISEHKFIRTTDKIHEEAAQEFWKKCDEAGFIEKKTYGGLYCVGCEMFLKENDLINGECPNHPGKKLEFLEEENYFFKYSNFAEKLLKLYESKKNFVVPDFRLNEIRNFVKNGLEDFSISRVAEKMPWGIPVPNDHSQVMYVWFDALVNYISTLGWSSDNDENFEKFWQSPDVVKIQICGKDNIQHQAARWQAMLLSVDLPTTDHVIVNGFITSNGQKMSKSLGNVIDPRAVVDEYNQYGSGADALRYYLLREIHSFEDSSFTMDRFQEVYNANLAKGLGNLVSRILKMAEDNLEAGDWVKIEEKENFEIVFAEEILESFNLQKITDRIWEKISNLDQEIAETEPFKLVKTDTEKAKTLLIKFVIELKQIAILLEPFLPETSEKILKAIASHKKPEPIFLRVK